MDRNKFSTILIFLVPQVLELVINEYKVDDEKAVEMFYTSDLTKGLRKKRRSYGI